MLTKKNNIESFDLLKFPLMLGVILIHSSEIFPSAAQLDKYTPFVSIIFVLINDFILSLCVPTFFVISGYLFFFNTTSFNRNVYKKKLNSRCRSLLLPFVLWTLLDFIYLAIKGFANQGFSLEDLSFLNDMLTPRIFWDYTPTGLPLHNPMWYVRNLLIMVAISPLLHCLLKRNLTAIISVFLFGILYVCFSSQTIWTSLLLSLFFFATGAAFSLHQDIITAKFIRICHFVIPLSAITLILCYLDILPHKLFTIMGIASCFIISDQIVKRTNIRVYKPFAESSFFVYCFHTFLIVGLAEYMLRLLIPDDCMSGLILLRYMLAPIIVYFICTAIYFILKKVVPNILSLLSGGRVYQKT